MRRTGRPGQPRRAAVDDRLGPAAGLWLVGKPARPGDPRLAPVAGGAWRPSPGNCESSPNSGPAWPSLEPEQAREELARVAKCQARTQEQVAELAGKLETASALAKSAWPNWQRGMATLLASGGLAGFEPIPEVLECLWQPLCRLDDDVGAADAVQAWLHERNLCQAQDHFYWQSSSRPAKAGPTEESWIIC